MMEMKRLLGHGSAALFGLLFVLLFGAVACSSSDEEPLPPQPMGWDEDIAPPSAKDLDPDPNVLEVTIEAREAEVEILPGIKTRMWTYNGMVPGPLLRAKRGDRVIVHFTNNLPEATTVHWHGLRVPAAMDGSTAVQDPVEPGESFTYDFVLPDAGTFWYHPHINSSTQVGYGLYGPIVVDDPNDPLGDIDDVVLVFSDLSLDDEGQLAPGDSNGWFGDYFGREGEVLLVNGKVRPRMKARPGLTQRWRVINAARARFFQLDTPRARLVRVGGDGGLIEHPLPIDKLLLMPSERAEVLVTPPSSGSMEVLFEDPDRFDIGVTQPTETLIDLELTGEPATGAPRIPDPLRTIPAFNLAEATTRPIEFGEQGVDGLTLLTINGVAHDPSSHDHGHHDGESAHVAYVGTTEIWEVLNSTDYSHPFHLHGFSFEVLDVDGVPWPVRELKDTAHVPPHQTLRFAVTYDDRPGFWMFHCHILDHVNLGMMAVLEVRRP